MTAQAGDRNQQERAAQLALHEEKKRYIAEWIARCGTTEQQVRQTAGVLPMDEAIEAITDQAFAAVADHPPYARDGADRLQAHLRSSRNTPTLSSAPPTWLL